MKFASATTFLHRVREDLSAHVRRPRALHTSHMPIVVITSRRRKGRFDFLRANAKVRDRSAASASWTTMGATGGTRGPIAGILAASARAGLRSTRGWRSFSDRSAGIEIEPQRPPGVSNPPRPRARLRRPSEEVVPKARSPEPTPLTKNGDLREKSAPRGPCSAKGRRRVLSAPVHEERGEPRTGVLRFAERNSPRFGPLRDSSADDLAPAAFVSEFPTGDVRVAYAAETRGLQIAENFLSPVPAVTTTPHSSVLFECSRFSFSSSLFP